MTTGVVIATYNGEQYIKEQLESILCQTRTPDEVFVSDDASTDATCRIISEFISSNKLNTLWKLSENEEQLGYIQNFHHAIKNNHSDIIFLCDQDDIWNDKKIEIMTDIMSEHRDVNLLSCNHIDYQTGGSKPKTGNRDECRLKKVSVNDALKSWNWPGMTMCFRRKWYDENFTVRNMQDIPHDLLFVMVAADQNCFYECNYIGVQHRIHESNTSPSRTGINQITDTTYKVVNYGREIEYYERLNSTFELNLQSKEDITSKIEYTKKRIDAIQNKDIIKAIKSYTTTSKRTRKTKSLVSDIYGILRNKS